LHKRDNVKDQLALEIDPGAEVKKTKARKKLQSDNTFGSIANEFLTKCTKEGKAETTIVKKRWLLEQAQSSLFHRPITEITAAEILVPLKVVEAKGNYESARRLRAEIGQVF